VSDTGVVKGEGWELTVEGVEKVAGKNAVIGTFGETFEPTAAPVNESRRRNVGAITPPRIWSMPRAGLGTHCARRDRWSPVSCLRLQPMARQRRSNRRDRGGGQRTSGNLPIRTHRVNLPRCGGERRDGAVRRSTVTSLGRGCAGRVSSRHCAAHVAAHGGESLFRYTRDGRRGWRRRIRAHGSGGLSLCAGVTTALPTRPACSRPAGHLADASKRCSRRNKARERVDGSWGKRAGKGGGRTNQRRRVHVSESD
jgi:hypothetical protein